MTIREYIAQHRDRFLEEWASLIRIPSISSEPAHQADMTRCAERWVELLKAAGCQHAEVMPSAGNPFVYGEYIPEGGYDKTVLVYAHYDVMPVDPIELWHSNPSSPISVKDASTHEAQTTIRARR